MAKVTRVNRTVKKMVEVEETQKGVSIDLTVDEAKVLITVLQNVGGPITGPRGVIDEISNGLMDADIMFPKGNLIDRHTGSIYFKHNNMADFFSDYTPDDDFF